MEKYIEFSWIRNRIKKHNKDDLIQYCLELLNRQQDEVFPVWYIFVLMKWTFIYGGKGNVLVPVDENSYRRIFEAIKDFNQDHITNFLKKNQIDRAFQILYNQQFYLQKTVYKEIYATQLKLFAVLKSKYDVAKSFENLTGLTILEFLFMAQSIAIYLDIKKLSEQDMVFKGYLDNRFLLVIAHMTSEKKVRQFLKLLTVNPNNVNEKIEGFKDKIHKEDLQTMEISFLTMCPFIHIGDKVRLIHKSIYRHTVNYYLYDFLKTNDKHFTGEFGYRLEKYVHLGLKELNLETLTENDLKKNDLLQDSSLVDFFLPENNIFIEVKGTELQPNSSVNPTDGLLYSALKSSLFKAYFKQLVPVSQKLSPDQENWGIIITYKEFFWSRFTELFKIGKEKYPSSFDNTCLPPENVFIIDLYTWDLVVQTVKNKQASLIEILKLAKNNNSNPATSKQLFSMHMQPFPICNIDLTYLEQEKEQLDIKVRKL